MAIHLTLDQVGGIAAGRFSRGNRRFHCPIHGGDGYSLSVVDDGDLAGVGHCHNAGCPGKEQTVVILDYPGRQNRPGVSSLHERVTRRIESQLVEMPIDPARLKEVTTLRSVHDRMIACAGDDRPLSYLAGRGVELSEDAGLGYIPETAKLGKWRDRLIFPLWSPSGVGYIGRALWGWQPGMDENEHKRILDEHETKGHTDRRRWEKTDPAGWYGPSADQLVETVIIVEGPFDRVALLAGGVEPCECLALVGTALNPEMLPRQVQRVVLAFDGDEAGQKAMESIARALYLAGIKTASAIPPGDGQGKDASERYRRAGVAGLAYIFDAWASLMPRPAHVSEPIPEIITPAPPILPILPLKQVWWMNCFKVDGRGCQNFTRHEMTGGDSAICLVCGKERTVPPPSTLPEVSEQLLHPKEPIASSGELTYSQRVNMNMAEGMDYMEACEAVTRENQKASSG